MPFAQSTFTLGALMDAALTLQLCRVWGRQPEGESLEQMFPGIGGRHIDQAMAEATMLLASAFSAGSTALATVDPDIALIILRLKRRHPGFSDASYRDVINFGCFLAR